MAFLMSTFFCRLLAHYHNLFVRAMQMQDWRGLRGSRRQAEIAKRLFLRMRSASDADSELPKRSSGNSSSLPDSQLLESG